MTLVTLVTGNPRKRESREQHRAMFLLFPDPIEVLIGHGAAVGVPGARLAAVDGVGPVRVAGAVEELGVVVPDRLATPQGGA